MEIEDYINDEKILKKLKWKKIYGKHTNRIVYEGYTLNNKPCGRGTSYYANGKKHIEGLFYIKGFIEGKEYYKNGQLHYEGKYTVCNSYGPNYPNEGTCYDKDGNILYSGKFKIIKRGSLGFPRIVHPTNCGHIINEDTDLEYLMWNDLHEAEKEKQVIKAYDESKYPMTYPEFKDYILNEFIKREWKYSKDFTQVEKKEFIESHELDFHELYNNTCEKYDKKESNLFEDIKDKLYPAESLLFECEMYYITKFEINDIQKPGINENTYPMTYTQFKEKLIGALIKQTNHYKIPQEEVIKDINELLENTPDYIISTYKHKCEEYDELTTGETRSVRSKYVFCDERISNDAYHWGTWLDYWLFI